MENTRSTRRNCLLWMFTRYHLSLRLVPISGVGDTQCDTVYDYLQFYVPLKNFSLIWRRHHCRWRAAKFRPMLGAQGLWAGRDLYRATPALTRGLGFSSLIRRTYLKYFKASYVPLQDHLNDWLSILRDYCCGFIVPWIFVAPRRGIIAVDFKWWKYTKCQWSEI
jgi:hypothetical protein